MSTLTEADEVLAELRQAGKLLLTTHENPDGDALERWVAARFPEGSSTAGTLLSDTDLMNS